MFSQGRGAGLSPGTSAHNPSDLSKPAKETEQGTGGGGEEFPDRENLLPGEEMRNASERNKKERITRFPACNLAIYLFATVRLYHTTG